MELGRSDPESADRIQYPDPDLASISDLTVKQPRQADGVSKKDKEVTFCIAETSKGVIF